MNISELIKEIKPYVLSWWSSDSPWRRRWSNYLIYVEGASCYALNGSTGIIDYSGSDHALVIQSAANAAGTGGVLTFRAGAYNIGTELTPGQQQTWWFNRGAVFRPTGNNRIFNITARDGLSFHGTLYIHDPSSLTTGVEAILIEDMAFCYFEHIAIVNYYRGISMTGTTGGTHENTFTDLYLQVRDRGLNLETSCHDNHFRHVWIKGPAPDNWATGPGLRIATGGTQGGNIFHQIEILDMDRGMDLPGAYEAWFGNVLVDNAYGEGILLGGSCERVFFDTVWTASSGDGVVIEGNAGALPYSYADKIHFGKLYTWLNAAHGLRFNGYVKWVTFNTLVAQRNAKGVAFYNTNNEDIVIDSLVTLENTDWGLNGENVGSNVVIQHAAIHDSLLNGAGFARLAGYTGSGSFKTAGIATLTNGTTTVVVNHGLDQTPAVVVLGPGHAEVADAYVSATSATTFTLTVSAPVTADRQIYWVARSRTNAL